MLIYLGFEPFLGEPHRTAFCYASFRSGFSNQQLASCAFQPHLGAIQKCGVVSHKGATTVGILDRALSGPLEVGQLYMMPDVGSCW